jgi:hypothetical protein
VSSHRIFDVRDQLERGRYEGAAEIDRTLSLAAETPRTPVSHASLLPRHFAFFFRSVPGLGMDETSAAPLYVLRADGASLAGRDGAVVFEGAWIDRIHLYFVNFGRSGCLFKPPQPDARTVELTGEHRRLKGSFFLSFSAAYTNYAHWMAEGLPALIAYRDLYMATGCRLLLPEIEAGHFINQAVRLLDIPEERIERVADELITVDTLYFLSHFNFVRLPAYASAAQKELKSMVRELPEARSRRLFVSRPDSSARRLLNEAEVLAALAKSSVEPVAPGLLSLADQIRTFHAADLIVGPHGAGLANCGFCEPNSSLLELFSEYTTQGHFWAAASGAGMRYGFIAGTSFDQDWGLTSEQENWSAPYVIDAAAVATVARDWTS